MASTKENLLAQVTAQITSNGNNEITGAVLRSVMESMAHTLHGANFAYKAHPSLTPADIGLLVMNNGSGEAVRYAYRPPSDEVPGQWRLTLEVQDHLVNTRLVIDSGEGYFEIDRDTWRDSSTPANEEEELEAIRDYINNHSELSTFLSASMDGDDLLITEQGYNDTEVRLSGKSDLLTVEVASVPRLPAMGTAFPLGLLIGLEGDTAIIAHGMVETYPLEGSITIEHQFYDTMGSLDLSDPESLLMETLAPMLVVPASNGKVKALNLDDLTVDSDPFTPKHFRTQILGIALAVKTGSVTVLNARMFSPFIGLGIRLYAGGMFSR